MKHGRELPAGGAFSWLIESSRRLFGHTSAATRVEIDSLSLLIEQEIIPRLQMRFTTAKQGSAALAADPRPPEYDVDGFLAALLSKSPDDAADYIDRLRVSDHSLVQVYQHLMAPAARQLGIMWENDDCGFAEVTIAIAKIRHLFIATAPLFPVHKPNDAKDSPSILMTTVPGEQHTFGLYLAIEHFRAHDWTVWSGAPRSAAELSTLVASERCDAVGITVGSQRNLEPAKEAVHNIKAHATNNDVVVIAGGALLLEHPELADVLDADLIVTEIDDEIIEQTASLVRKRRDSLS